MNIIEPQTGQNPPDISSFTINTEVRNSTQESMLTKLENQCTEYGYTSCEAVYSDKLFEPLQVVTEQTRLSIGEAKISYGRQKIHAIVMGSASGDPKDCPFHL